MMYLKKLWPAPTDLDPMQIIKTSLPENSVLKAPGKRYDYTDSFSALLKDPANAISPEVVGKAFFTSAPKWIDHVLQLRDKVAAVFGLKTSGNSINRQKQLDNFRCEPGQQLGLFKVFDKTLYEVVLGEDDKHLNFRVSLFLNISITNPAEKVLTITTVVRFNNWFGRIYFLPVKPFHSLIVPAMLKAIVKEIEKNGGWLKAESQKLKA